MKRIRRIMALAALLTCFGVTLSETWAQEQTYYIYIDSTNFPDAKFRSFVRANYDSDEDGRLSDEEIREVTEMKIDIPNAVSSGGVDITGIEHFKYLEELRCERLGLTKLDVSALPNLWCLWCGYNKLRAIKLPNSLGFLDFPVNKFDEEAMEALIEELPEVDFGYLIVLALDDPDEENVITPLQVAKASKKGWYSDAVLTKQGNVTREIAGLSEGFVKINTTNFPDENFRTYISENFDTNGDHELREYELRRVTTIDVSNKNIESLKGVDYFTYMEELYCGSNKLREMVFNKELVFLRKLDCHNNSLSRLVVAGCSNLTKLNCRNNNLGSLVLSYNTKLDTLICNDNNLSILNLKNNTKLKVLDCSGNPITSLDFYNNKALKDVNCSNCRISEAAMQKVVSSLPGGATDCLFKVRNNYNANEKNVINSDQVFIARQKGWKAKEYKADHSSCDNCIVIPGWYDYEGTSPSDFYIDMNETTFPDAKFRQALFYEDYGKDEVLGSKEIAKVKTMDVHGEGIANLKGVEYFTELTTLNVALNDLKQIDLTRLTKLTKLICYMNEIGEDEMDALIASLPTVSGGQLLAVNLNNTTEKNIVTTVQVAAAAQKGWTVKAADGTNYAGCAPTGVALTAENFPDATLLSKLKSQWDANQNGLLSAGEVSYITYLGMDNKNATTLKGIEHLTALTQIDCFQNKIDEDHMEELVRCLPTVSGGKLYAINTGYASEQNYITTAQVAAAQKKGWTVYDWRTKQPYEGKPATGYAINETYFPDAAFRNVVKQFDANSNGKLSTSEVAAVTEIVATSKGISDLTGVELFTNLTSLHCKSNSLTKLNVSKLTKLTVLDCSKNANLTSLDVTKLTKLQSLFCNECGLYSLNLSKNTNLVYLHCYGNRLSALDLTANTKLTTLYCYDNRIVETAMQRLVDALPQITSGQGEMRAVTLNYTGEQNVMSSEQVAVATGKNWVVKARSGNTVTFNNYAGASPTILVEINKTNFPDTPFREYILSNIDKNGDNKLSVGEASSTTEINIWGKNQLYYMRGLKYFTELKALYLNWNYIDELDVSKNTKLETLTFAGNRVKKMDLSKNTKLKRVDCYQNQIDEAEMEALINSLPTTTGAKLSAINPNYEGEQNVVSSSQVAAAAAKGWTVTTGSSSGGNVPYAGTTPSTPTVNEQDFPDPVFRQYVSEKFDTDHNGVLSFAELKAAMTINVDYKGISTLEGIEYFSWLETLSCNGNNLWSLDVSQNPNLKYLYIFRNHFSEEAMGELIDGMPEAYQGVMFALHSSWDDEENFISPEQVAAVQAKGWSVYNYPDFPDKQYEGSVHEGVKIDEESFPDPAFRSLVSYTADTNRDGYLVDTETDAVTTLDVANNGIESMKGIELFKNLQYLDCSGNQLKSFVTYTLIGGLPVRPENDGVLLFSDDEAADEGNEMSTSQVDVAKGKGWNVVRKQNGEAMSYEGVEVSIYLTKEFFPDAALRSHIASVNHLNEGDELTDDIIQRIIVLRLKDSGVKDITGYQYLSNLFELNCYGLDLETLDVSMLPELMVLDCSSNRWLKELNLSNNKKLRQLKCGGNQIQLLDVSMLPDLELLECKSDQLRVLKMGNHPNLTQLRCQANHLNAIQMGKVVDALPQRPSSSPGMLMVNDKYPSNNRINTIYKSQVAEAVAKGWNVVNSSGEEYEGCDPVMGSGDADMNGRLNEWDLEILNGYILGYIPDEAIGFDQMAVDINGDGRIDIEDATLLIEMLKQ